MRERTCLIAAFHDDAKAFCDFIDRLGSEPIVEPAGKLLVLLSNLAKSGASLPFDMAIEKVDGCDRVDHVRWQQIASDVHTVFSQAFVGLMTMHATDGEALVRSAMLDDDLADIYRDLRDGLDLYASGDPNRMAHAVWHWKFSYESHWGPHLFRALTTVHEIRFRLNLE